MIEFLFAPLRAVRNEYWERALSRETTRSRESIAISLGIAAAAMGFVWITEKTTGHFMTSILLLALVAIALILDPLLTTLLAVVLSFFADYFYIPPIGTLLGSARDGEHLIILCGVGFTISYLVQALRRSLIEQIELQASKKSIDQAVKLITHDLRNPLGGIKLRAQLLKDEKAPPDRQKELASKIEQACERMDVMIQSIIEASLFKTSPDIKIDFTFCDLTSIVREAVDESFGENRKMIEVSGETSPLYGYWGRGLIKRAVENLLSNAIKYGSPRHIIKVRVARQDDQKIAVSVQNFGNEISANEQQEIFASFYRGKTAKDTVGWGLGLAMVKSVAAAHNGSVHVSSGHGKGTIFTMVFPSPSQVAIPPPVANAWRRT